MVVFHCYVSSPEGITLRHVVPVGCRSFRLSDGGFLSHHPSSTEMPVIIFAAEKLIFVANLTNVVGHVSYPKPVILIWVCLKIGYIPNEIAI